jgi:hypothetical protein
VVVVVLVVVVVAAAGVVVVVVVVAAVLAVAAAAVSVRLDSQHLIKQCPKSPAGFFVGYEVYLRPVNRGYGTHLTVL